MKLLDAHRQIEVGNQRSDAEALIREAKQRERRRRIGLALAVVVVIGLIAALVGVVGSGGGRTFLAGSQPLGKGTPTVDVGAFHGYGDLAFISQGNLFVLDGTTDKLVAVTTGHQQASNPAFSPNGKWLTFITSSGSWLARSNGTDPRKLAGPAQWAPNGELALSTTGSTTFYAVAENESLRRIESTSPVKIYTVDGTTEYLFFSDTLKVQRPKASSGVERIEIANSLHGVRTLWYETHLTFTAAGGMQGVFMTPVAVLPHHDGLLLTISNYCCDYADGQSLYELQTPLGTPRLLATVLNGTAITFGPHSTFAFEGGGNRYAWVTKDVKICDGQTAQCSAMRMPKGELSLSPAWSLDGRTLALVEARAGVMGRIGQPQIDAWYATHQLFLWSGDRSKPTEVTHTQGAANPVWSSNSKSLLYVKDDALYLVPNRGVTPEKIAGPLFPPQNLFPHSYYGEIGWAGQFAWSKS